MVAREFTQDGYAIRLEWGAEGVAALRACGVLVVVDVLAFTTSVDIAVGRGARILPLPWQGDGSAEAARTAGATMAGERGWTLRPASLLAIPAGTLLAVPSPNGATLCRRAAESGARVLAGCLRNAGAVAERAAVLAGGRPIGVLPAGERWVLAGRPPRPSVEDQLGAGAIVAALDELGVGPASPEAALAADGFRAVRDVGATLAGCASGRELIAGGNGADVPLAADVDVSAAVPVLVDGVLGATP